jgi:hypothetical protein
MLLGRDRHGGNPVCQGFLLQQAQQIFQGFHPHHGIHVHLHRIRRWGNAAAGSVTRVCPIEVDRELPDHSELR